MNVLSKGTNLYQIKARGIYLFLKRKKLKNKDICLISSNCNGAAILHDMKLQFNSPFVNLWIKPKDFIKMVSSLEEYLDYDLEFTTESGIDYPIGVLKDIKIYFQHYKSEEEAHKKWDERKRRVNYENIYILFSDRDGCTEEDLNDFDNLAWERKTVFVNRPHKTVKSSCYIKGFEDAESVGVCTLFRSKFSYKKYYDDFDYVEWFNTGKTQRKKS